MKLLSLFSIGLLISHVACAMVKPSKNACYSTAENIFFLKEDGSIAFLWDITTIDPKTPPTPKKTITTKSPSSGKEIYEEAERIQKRTYIALHSYILDKTDIDMTIRLGTAISVWKKFTKHCDGCSKVYTLMKNLRYHKKLSECHIKTKGATICIRQEGATPQIFTCTNP